VGAGRGLGLRRATNLGVDGVEAVLDRNQARKIADALLEPGRRKLVQARAARARRFRETARWQRRGGGAMAGFGIGALTGHCFLGSASPANLVGMALGLCLVYLLQRRGAARGSPRE
jgi:hypothetical protein